MLLKASLNKIKIKYDVETIKDESGKLKPVACRIFAQKNEIYKSSRIGDIVIDSEQLLVDYPEMESGKLELIEISSKKVLLSGEIKVVLSAPEVKESTVPAPDEKSTEITKE